MDQAQGVGKELDIKKGEITIEDPVTQGVLVKSRDNNHLLTHSEIFIHLKSQG
jgi:hypothetical protein